jgi:O-antigen/teichoic acid export membrane protein
LAKSLKFKSLTSLFSQIIQFLSGLIITPFVVNGLGETYFSLWVVFLSLVSFEGFLLLGTPQSLNRYVPFYLGKRDNASLSSLIRGQVVFSIATYVLIIFFITFFSNELFTFFELDIELHKVFHQSLYLMTAGLSLSIANKILIALNNGQEKYAFYNILLSVSIIARLSIIILFIDNGFMVMPVGYLIGQLILFLGLFISFLRGQISIFKDFDLKRDVRVFKVSFAFGAASMLMYVADILRHQLDTFLILKFVGLEEITHYKVGITLITSVNALNAGLFGVILTRLSFHQGAREEEEFKGLSLRSYFYSSFFGSYFILGISLLAPNFLRLWMGNYDISSLHIIYILLIPQLLMLTQYPSINVMYSLNKQKVMGIMTLIESVINCAVSLILISRVGIIGVVIGTAVGFILSKGIVLPFLLRRFCGLSLKKQFLQIMPQYLCAVFSFIPLYFLFDEFQLGSDLIDFFFKCLMITLTFIMSLKVFYFFSPKEEARILSVSGLRSIFK